MRAKKQSSIYPSSEAVSRSKETVQVPGDRLGDGGQPHGRPQCLV